MTRYAPRLRKVDRLPDPEAFRRARCAGRWQWWEVDRLPDETETERRARLADAAEECWTCPALAACVIHKNNQPHTELQYAVWAGVIPPINAPQEIAHV